MNMAKDERRCVRQLEIIKLLKPPFEFTQSHAPEEKLIFLTTF